MELLQSINVEVVEGTHKGQDVYLAKTNVDCSNCPFNSLCEDPCPTVQSYFERRMKPKQDAMSKGLVDFDAWEKFGRVEYDRLVEADSISEPAEVGDWIDEKLPWDCLSDRQRQCLQMKLYRGMTNREIAFDISSQENINISHVSIGKHVSSAIGKP